MNTPAHIALNLLCIGRNDSPSVLLPVALGALLPDVPIFIFYGVEKLIFGVPESVIWSQSYYQPGWQTVIALSHSLPLMLLGLSLSFWRRSHLGLLLFSSMILHVAGDLPLHHDDAHRHFFPLSNWRFISPVSYWDPRYYGDIFGVIEAIAVLVSCGWLWRIYQSKLSRAGVLLIGGIYIAYLIYVVLVWV